MNSANRTLLCAALIATLANAEAPVPGSDPPKIHAETLNGKAIELPQAAAGKITLLILGFSKVGGEQTRQWQEQASRDFASDPRFTSYAVAVLEGVPSLLRGMVKSGMRSGTPAPKRDHVVTTMSGEAAWRTFFGVSDAKVPYLVLIDGAGHVRWSGHGSFEAGQYEAFRSAVKDTEAQAGQRP